MTPSCKWPIGHSCCGVPANVLSFCLFYFGEANKIKNKKNKVTVISGFLHKPVQRLQKYFRVLPPAHPIECCNSEKVWKQTFNAVRSLWGGGEGGVGHV